MHALTLIITNDFQEIWKGLTKFRTKVTNVPNHDDPDIRMLRKQILNQMIAEIYVELIYAIDGSGTTYIWLLVRMGPVMN